MPAACRPKNEAANFIFPPWIRLFFRYPCVPPTPLQLSSVAMTSHTSLDGVPGAWRQTLSTAVSCLEEGRAARGEVLRRVVWRTAMTSHSLDGVPGAAWLVWRGEGVVCLGRVPTAHEISLFITVSITAAGCRRETRQTCCFCCWRWDCSVELGQQHDVRPCPRTAQCVVLRDDSGVRSVFQSSRYLIDGRGNLTV